MTNVQQDRMPASAVNDWIASLTMDDLTYDTERVFARLREEAPLAWIPAMASWIATSWEVCEEIAGDAERFQGGTSPIHERVFGSPHILGAEGSVHQDIRSAIGAPIGPRVVRKQIEERVRPTARALIEKLRDRDGAELLSEYFEPISVRSVADAYGFFDVDSETLQRWFHGLAAGTVNAAVNPDGTFANPDGFLAADQARSEIHDYLADLAERTKHDTDSVMWGMLNSGRPSGDPRSLEFLMPSLLVVLLGGLQEPGHGSANTFYGLTTRPDQMHRVISDHALLPKAIVEGLRWLSPLYGGASRVPTSDVTFAGGSLRAGDTVWLIYGSANRDGRVFDTPDVFDLDRVARGHLAFGMGRHSCAGSGFAPQITRVALEELFSAFPDVRLDPAHEVEVAGWHYRSPGELHVRWR